MKLLPFFIRFKICGEGWWMPTLWFPIVLLWPLFFIILFVMFFAGLIAVVILDTRSVKRFVPLFTGLYTTLCELRGTKVEVESRENKIFIAID